MRNGRHTLVTGGTDRVKTFTGFLHCAADAIQLPTQHLGAKQADSLDIVERGGRGIAQRQLPRRHPPAKVLMYDFYAIHGASKPVRFDRVPGGQPALNVIFAARSNDLQTSSHYLAIEFPILPTWRTLAIQNQGWPGLETSKKCFADLISAAD